MKRKIRLVAIDVDGTMYNEKKEMTERVFGALAETAKRGVQVVAATGRSLNTTPQKLYEIPEFTYAITCNGAAVYHAREKRLLFGDSMPYAEAGALFRELWALDILLDVFVGDAIYRDESKTALVERLSIPQVVKKFIIDTRTTVAGLPAYLERERPEIHKFTLNFLPEAGGERKDYNHVVEILKKYPNFTAVSGGHGNLEISKRTATKGNGLQKLAAYLHIPIEETAAIGDSGNDREMLKKAGLAVAMGNAEAQVKEVADLITASNEEDGVACALEGLALCAY